MNRPDTRSPDRPERRDVLIKVVVRAAERLRLSGREPATALGLSPASVSRLMHGDHHLDPRYKSRELATIFPPTRVCRRWSARAAPQAGVATSPTRYHCRRMPVPRGPGRRREQRPAPA